MRKLANDCIAYFKNSKFFRKTVLTYVIVGCIMFFLFGFLTILIISKSAMSQMNSTEQNMLSQACNTSDLVFRDIHSISYNKFAEDSAIRDAMTEPYSVSVSQRVQSAFSDIMASSSLIDSIYAVNYKYDIIYSTETSVKKTSDFFDTDILEHLASQPPKSEVFFPRKTELTVLPLETIEKEYITSIYRNSKDFALVVNIDQNRFCDMVNLSSDTDNYDTAVIASNGMIIAHSNPDFFATNVFDDPKNAKTFQKTLAADGSHGTIKYSGTVINFVRSDILGYTYHSMSKNASPFGSFSGLIIYMIIFTVLLLLMYLVSTMLVSLQTYYRFSSLRRSIYKLFNKKDDNNAADEVENISKLLREVKTGYNSMETIQYQYINSKQNETLRRLLSGTFAYLQEDMKACNITFPYSGFAVVLTQIDNASKMDSETIYTIKYAVTNMGTEIFESKAKAYAVEMAENDVAFILNFMEDGFINEAIDTLNSYLRKFFDATVSAAYDIGISDSVEDISVLYHNAKHALPYKLVRGHASVITCDEIIRLDSSVSSYPKDIEQDIIKNITAQDDEALNANIDKFIQQLQKTSYNMIMLYTDRLLLAIDQFAIRSNMSDGNEASANIQTIIQDIETLEEMRQYILTKCRNLMLKFSNTRFDSKKDIMVKQVLDYIEKNYTDPNLSIDMISSEINRSANYTRSMFKQSQGISISDYIAKKRFDEVCRLLIETNLTAQEIGARLGLNSGSYFYTSFKKHTGYTPDQYRKLHHK